MPGVRLIGYTRASRWAGSGHEAHIEEQRRELEQALGSPLAGIESDRVAGRSLRRPGLQAALAACAEGRADGVAVTSLDRLSRSLDDLSELFAEAQAGGFRIVALAQGLDTATASGALVERVLAEAGAWGRRSLARERARATFDPSARGRRGRPVSTPPDVADRIRAMRR